jgi:hypothetical protein
MEVQVLAYHGFFGPTIDSLRAPGGSGNQKGRELKKLDKLPLEHH